MAVCRDPYCHCPDLRGDPCPCCGEADLEKKGTKEVCPACHYIQPCCQP